jgi:hypothetical protein
MQQHCTIDKLTCGCFVFPKDTKSEIRISEQNLMIVIELEQNS